MGAQNLFFPLVNTEFPLCVNLKSIFNNVFLHHISKYDHSQVVS